MAARKRAKTEVEIKHDIVLRKYELKAALVEYACLTQMLELIEHFKAAQRVTYDGAKAWVKATYGPTDMVKPAELRDNFDRDSIWSNRMLKRLVEDGVLERFGRGLYRVPPVKTGEARLSVVS